MSGRKFTELNAGTVGANSIFAQAQAPATPGDPYTSTKVSATDVGNFVNGTQAYADIGNVTPLAAIAALQQGGASTANANIADEYDSSHTYNTGDRVIYEGVLYVCNDDNVTGAWDSTKWDSATIDEIISALTAADIPYSAGVSVADKLDSLTTELNPTYSTNGLSTPSGITIQDGGFCIIGKLVLFNIRLNLTNTVASETDILSGLPTPNADLNNVAVTINKDTYAVLTTSGNVRIVNNQLTYGVCLISGTYLTV